MQPDNNDLYSRLGSIEAKVDLLLTRDITTEARLMKLEKFEARAGGIAAVVSAVVAAMVTYLARHI